MNNKYTKIPCTLHWAVHYVDLKQNQKGNFEIEWARGSHKGQTDRIPCDDSNKVNYESNFEIPCTMFVHKDDQSIRNKQLKITLKRFVDNKLPKVYGKLTLDIGKYYQQQMEMQAASGSQHPQPIKEDIEMETGRSIAPVLNCTFNLEQVGKIEIGDVDQNDISYAGGTVDKMRVGLDDWDVTENEAALNEENSHHGKHSHGKKKDKSKKKSKKNKDKDKDKEATEKTNNDNDNNAEKGELEDKYLSSSNEKLQAANTTPNDEKKEKSQPISNESSEKKTNEDQKNKVNEKKEGDSETDADKDKDQVSVARKEGENETDADKDQKTEKKKDKKKKKGKKKSKNDDKTKSENEEGVATEDEQEKIEQKSDEEKADTKQSDEKKSKKKKSRKSESGRKKSPKKSKNADEDNANQEGAAEAVVSTERKIDIDEDEKEKKKEEREEKEKKKEEREEKKERKEENEKDKEEKVLITEENEEKEILKKKQKEEAKEKAEKEAKEQREKAEKEAKEKADQEAKEKAEKEAKDHQEKAEKEAKEQQEKAEKEANVKAEKEKQDQQNTDSNEKADQETQSKSASVAEEKESKASKSDQESKEKEEEEEEEEAKEEKPKKSKKSKKRKSDSTNLNLSIASDSNSTSNSLSASNASIQSAQPIIVDNPTPKQEIEAVTAKSWSISNVDGYIDDSDQFPFPACVFPFYATLLHTRSIFDYSREAEKSNSSSNNERLELVDYFIECYEDAPLCERCTPQQNMLTSLLLVLLSENQKGIKLLEKNAKQRKEMVLIDNSKYFSMKMGVYIEKSVDNFLAPILQKFEVTINRFITAKFEMDPLLSDFKHVFRTMENQLSFSKGINKMLMTLLLAKLEHRMIIKLISNPMRFMFNNAIVWNSFMSALLFDERIGLEILREVVFVLVMANGIADDPSLKNDIAPHIEPKVVLYIMKNYHPDIMLPQPIKVDNFVSHFFSCTKEEAFKEIETEKVPDVPCAVTLKTYKEDIKDGLNLDLWNKRAINDNAYQQYKWLKEFHK